LLDMDSISGLVFWAFYLEVRMTFKSSSMINNWLCLTTIVGRVVSISDSWSPMTFWVWRCLLHVQMIIQSISSGRIMIQHAEWVSMITIELWRIACERIKIRTVNNTRDIKKCSESVD
jgi:hypothetical protein